MTITEYFRTKLFGQRQLLPSPQGTQIGGRIAYPDKAGYIANVTHGFNSNPVVAACVGLYASTLNEPPLGVLRTDGSVDTNHPLSLLFRRPNKHMGQSDFWQIVWTYLAISGNCYVKKVRSDYGNVVELIPYSDAYVVPILDELGWVSGYKYQSNSFQQHWKLEDVIHLHNPAYRDPLKMHMGVSPIEIAWDKINTYNELQSTMYSLVASNAVPSGILSAPTDISVGTIESLKQQLQKRKNAQGRERTDPLVLGSGMTYTQMGLDSTKLQANEMLQELEVAICGAFRIHPVVALTSAGLARSTYNNIQSAYQEYTTLTRVPYWNAIEEQIEAGLFAEYPSIQVEFDLSEVQALQPDADAMIYPVVAEFKTSIITQNEVRKKLGFEPIESGDVFYHEIITPKVGTMSDEIDTEEKIAMSKQYEDIDFTPPQGVREEAVKGLEWRNEYGRGGTEVGVARARDLSNGVNISPDTARRMKSYFARHEVDKQGQGWSPDQEGFPSAGRIAWALWGGDAGQTWSEKLVRQMDAEDANSKDDSRIAEVTTKDGRSKVIWNEDFAVKSFEEHKAIVDEYIDDSIDDVLDFIGDIEAQAISRSKSKKKSDAPELSFADLIEKFMKANKKKQDKLFTDILDTVMKNIDGNLETINSELDDVRNAQTKEMLSKMAESGKTFQKEMNKLFAQNPNATSSEMSKLISEKFTRIAESRAALIAETVATAQSTVVQNEAMSRYNERQPKEDRYVNVWLSMRDSKVRDTHELLDGEWAEIGESFDKYVSGVGVGPGLGSKIEEVARCRCIVTPVRITEVQ